MYFGPPEKPQEWTVLTQSIETYGRFRGVRGTAAGGVRFSPKGPESVAQRRVRTQPGRPSPGAGGLKAVRLGGRDARRAIASVHAPRAHEGDGRKGRNRILYRIENGWRHVAWSLVIHAGRR